MYAGGNPEVNLGKHYEASKKRHSYTALERERDALRAKGELSEQEISREAWLTHRLLNYFVYSATVEKKVLPYLNLEGNWNEPTRDLDQIEVNTTQDVLQIFEFFIDRMTNLYDASTPMLDLDLPGINLHDVQHVLRLVLRMIELFKIALDTRRQEGESLDQRDLLVCLLDALFHDSALAISGAKKKHAELGAEIAVSALKGNSELARWVREQVSYHVENHETNEFDAQRAMEDPNYAILVLADEIEMSKHRVSPTSMYKTDLFGYINKRTLSSELVRSSRNGRPVWVLTHDIDTSDANTAAEFEKYDNGLRQHIVGITKKKELFNVCITSIFGRPFNNDVMFRSKPGKTTEETVENLKQQVREAAMSIEF